MRFFLTISSNAIINFLKQSPYAHVEEFLLQVKFLVIMTTLLNNVGECCMVFSTVVDFSELLSTVLRCFYICE